MQPSNRWFPTTQAERAAWCTNFSPQFTDLALALGFSNTEATSNAADCALVVNLSNIMVQLDAYAAAVRQFRTIILESDIGDPTPLFPDNPSYSNPSGQDTGVFERIDNLVKRIRVAPTYTPEIGALLGIIPASTERPPDNELQPTLKTMSLPGSVLEVKFTRGQTDGVVIETKVDNSDTWSVAGRYFTSPAEVVIPSGPQNLPRSVQMRARYVEGNTPVGQYSDTVNSVTQHSA